ncbi:MAG: hypothetical protein AABW58_01425 [Nanoarchaeota archaeon]
MALGKNKLEELAREGNIVNVRLSLANVGIFSFELPRREERENFTLGQLKEHRTGAKAFKEIEKAAEAFLKKEYNGRYVELKADLGQAVILEDSGNDDRSELYDVVCSYKVVLKPKKQEVGFGD